MAVQQLQDSILQLNIALESIRRHFPHNRDAILFADACYTYCAGFMNWR